MNEPESPPELRDPTLLFEEYLRAWDTGQPVDLADLCTRAGPREADLKKRIEIFRTLQELSDTLDTPAANGASVPVDIAKIGRFERLVRIGQGGLSQVFLAHDPSLKRNVALKILSPDQITTSDARGWIASEAQSLARLDHPGVVRVFEVDEADGFAYVAMEYLAGPSLAVVIDRLRTGAPSESPGVEAAAARLSTVAARCRLVLQLARALAYCHEQGIVHRDIKPGNILLQANGEPKWIDFGLAHIESDSASLTQVTQRLMGTPAYIAPEQVDGGRTGASPLSDQFSLGVVLYELLTSKNAFMRSSRSATLDAISRAEPPSPRKADPSIPVDVERICMHALERSPDARYPSLDAMANDIEAFLEHRPISLRAPTPVQRLALWARRHRREIAISSTALGAALVVALALWVGSALRERSQLEGRLAELDAAIEPLVDPPHFVDHFRTLDALQNRAGELGRGVLASVLGTTTERTARSIVDRSSKRMSGILDSRLNEIYAQPMEGTRLVRDLLAQWDDALEAEAVACPSCEHNKRDRERGLVDLPTPESGQTLKLWQYDTGPAPLAPVLREIGLERARPSGMYRLQVLDAEQHVSLEGEFLVAPELVRRPIELHPLHPVIADRMIEVGRTTLFVRGANDVAIAAHRIMRDPMRWSDLALAGWPPERCNGVKASCEGLAEREFDWDAPAMLEWNVALDVATALGARLPTGCELAAALRDATVEFPGRGTDFVGELSSSAISDGDDISTFRYEGQSPRHKLQSPFVEGWNAKRRFLTFRLAQSADQ
jgi:serine/threonine protein kinase